MNINIIHFIYIYIWQSNPHISLLNPRICKSLYLKQSTYDVKVNVDNFNPIRSGGGGGL